MRNLFLLRHAQAGPAAEDRARPLSAKGRTDAAMLAEKMLAFKMIPDYVICSTAKRTRETCDVLMKTLPETSILYPEYVYEATTNDLFSAIQKIADTSRSLLIIGHNPSIQSLASFLTNKNDNGSLSDILYSYQPCTLSVVECKIDQWSALQPAENALSKVIAN